jgi:ABC-type multidrug transport system ATPase subunit
LRPRAVTERLGAVVADQLTKDYGDGVGLDPLDLRIEVGERVALVGHNGSGKTTFLRMMAGLLEPTSGSVTIHGHPAGSQPARAAVSFCGDQPTFYDDLSLWEHLEFVARMHGHDEPDQLAADLLGELGLYERADDLPNRFSRGLRQKAALAVSFIRPFELLLVDEPFVGLDLAGRDALLDLLDRATDGGATVVVATHELSFLQRVDRAIVLADGVLVHDGAADDPAVETLLRGGH